MEPRTLIAKRFLSALRESLNLLRLTASRDRRREDSRLRGDPEEGLASRFTTSPSSELSLSLSLSSPGCKIRA